MFVNSAIKLSSSIQEKKQVIKGDGWGSSCLSDTWQVTCCCSVHLIALIEGAFSVCRSDVKYWICQ